MQQKLARAVSQPDFLFSANDGKFCGPGIAYVTRTGTSNWLDNAAANGSANGGPGVITPPVQIAFGKLGPQYFSEGSGGQIYNQSQFFASFDASTNLPIVYPIQQAGTNQMMVRLWFTPARNDTLGPYEWKPCSLAGTQYAMQASKDLLNWTTLFTVTNNGSVCIYNVAGPFGANQFYRLIPQ
jgi:hypothetical protein